MRIHDGKRFEGEIRDYRSDFIASAFWKKLRVRYFSKPTTIKVCFICGTNNNLQLHHRSYKKVRHNTINNLICLCQDCHHSVHFKDGKRVPYPTRLNDYIRLAVEHGQKVGAYPYHLNKYNEVIMNILGFKK